MVVFFHCYLEALIPKAILTQIMGLILDENSKGKLKQVPAEIIAIVDDLPIHY